jgi:nucleoside-diphosphate-sugar epimerase
MKALVTGGGGFLGKAVVRKLVERGNDVQSFSRGNYPDLEKLGVAQNRGDLADFEAISRAVSGCDTVFHVGAKAGYWGPYEEYYYTNVIGTENVINACKKHGIRRLVYTSSPSVVFGKQNMEGADESVPYPDPKHYLAAYPKTKAMAEQMVLKVNSKELATVSLRPHLIWGPADNHLLPRIINKAKAGRLMFIGKGDNLIDTVYIENAAKAHLLAADRLFPGSSISGNVFFITNGEPRSMKEIINNIMEIYELPKIHRRVNPKMAYFGGWVLETIHKVLRIKKEPLVTRFIAKEFGTAHWFDISAAKNDLNYKPEEYSIDRGMHLLRKHVKNLVN